MEKGVLCAVIHISAAGGELSSTAKVGQTLLIWADNNKHSLPVLAGTDPNLLVCDIDCRSLRDVGVV